MAIGGVSSPVDSFVVNQTFVLRINPDRYRDGENRHLRQARNVIGKHNKKDDNNENSIFNNCITAWTNSLAWIYKKLWF